MGESFTGITAELSSARAGEVAGSDPREPLWREALGARLRRKRRAHGLTLDELAARAGLSPQYLSEIERGRKEPSSEMIAAVAGSLGLGLLDLTTEVVDELRRSRRGVLGFVPSSSAAPEERLDDADRSPRAAGEAMLAGPPLGVAA